MNRQTRSAAVLGIFVLVALTLLGLVNKATKDRISQAHQQWMLDNLSEVLPPEPFDSNPILSLRQHIEPELGGSEQVAIYTAFKNQHPAAAVLELVAPNGYSGEIRLLLGIHPNGEIITARVIEHRETPGLGDDIEFRKSVWITQFDGRSLNASVPENWQVAVHGGQFDALTGATVTSRAVIQAIYRALQWFEGNRKEIFRQ